jgi:hypothetical protein
MYSSTRVLGHGVLVGILYDETRLANHSYRGTRSFLEQITHIGELEISRTFFGERWFNICRLPKHCRLGGL